MHNTGYCFTSNTKRLTENGKNEQQTEIQSLHVSL